MGDIKTKSTDLFSKPSFLRGASRVFDISGKLDEYNYQTEADDRAIEKDWKIVGQDIGNATEKYDATGSK